MAPAVDAINGRSTAPMVEKNFMLQIEKVKTEAKAKKEKNECGGFLEANDGKWMKEPLKQPRDSYARGEGASRATPRWLDGIGKRYVSR
jgi:hypothetical protein